MTLSDETKRIHGAIDTLELEVERGSLSWSSAEQVAATAAEMFVGLWERGLPRCLGTTMGSGGHKMHARDCDAFATWSSWPATDYSSDEHYCDAHAPRHDDEMHELPWAVVTRVAYALGERLKER